MPPKKDAFADLFQSANTKNSNGVNSKLNKLSLTERQKLEQQQKQKTHLSNSSSNLNSSWSNLDILSPQLTKSNGSQVSSVASSINTSAMGSTSQTPQAIQEIDDDPFSIFAKSSNGEVNKQAMAKPVSTQASVAKPQETSLLDDDFTDLFPEQRREQQSQPQQQQPSKPSRPDVIRKNSNVSSTRSSVSIPRSTNGRASPSAKDHTIAALVDIGFTIEDANDAISHSGTDLQKCVNYIMNKNTSQSRASNEDNYEGDSILGKRPDSINFNELGNNLFQKANTFLNFSKRKVMENIEQFNSGGNSPFDIGRRSSQSPNLPEWMRNQAKYKSQAYEKKFGGEDYGDDEDNINQDEIDKFMRVQREKERQRLRQRFDQRSGSGSGINGDEDRGSASSSVASPRNSISKESSPAPPAKPPRPAARNNGGGIPASQNAATSEKQKQASPTVSPLDKRQQAATEEEVDLLGISTSGHTTSISSSLRDTSPLNQFIETDYTTHKAKATEAFKSGDYTTALESYTTCVSILPPKHELRVVMNSNLALTNKLQGHLKQSLENVEKALELMQLEECSSNPKGLQKTGGGGGDNNTPQLAGKPVKYWYLKVVIIKAEVLELLEKYQLALETYNLLVQKLGCMDKKVMDGKRRVDKIVNPDNYKSVTPKPKPKPTASPVSTAPTKKTTSKAATTSSTSTAKPSEVAEELDPLEVDGLNNSITQWAESKNNDLRQMLINLQVIIPHGSININENLLKLSLNDLVLPKQVKLNYMKVISSIHPDKLASQFKSGHSAKDKRIQLVCNGVFIHLNERWEIFRKEENI
ncbi:SWA2 [Candida margitis]|uniref:SWA2 n=1 Tax=Candida margitis TaxID=1775924 RepID=UPI002227A5B3|nr:SWA2 [Candida margitis]KAI5965534.1 SWA2 [Candida margitis]